MSWVCKFSRLRAILAPGVDQGNLHWITNLSARLSPQERL
jgi:hypothetical protein